MRKVIIILLCGMILVPLSGCSFQIGKVSGNISVGENAALANSGSDASKGVAARSATIPYAEDASLPKMDDIPVNIIENLGPPAVSYEVPTPGNADFSVDEGSKVSQEYKADGDAITLSLTDQAGMTWELSIPKGALDEDTTISMTALTGIKSEKLGKIGGGVRFEPDGLQFLIPATLTVSGKGIGEKSLLLSGNNDGSKMGFSYVEKGEAGKAKAKITHFSTEFVGTDMDPQKRKEILKEAMDWIKAETAAAKELLQEPIDAPVPPDISLLCDKHRPKTPSKEEEQEALRKFGYEFEEPESSIIATFIQAQRTVLLLGGNAETPPSILALQKRLLKKVDALIKKYDPSPEKFSAVARETIKLFREITLMSNGGDGSQEQAYFSRLANWAKKIADNYIKQIREKHDLTVACGVLKAYNTIGTLGFGQDQDLSKLEKALAVRIEVEESMNYSNISYQVDEKIPMDIKITGIGGRIDGSGAGKGSYMSCKVPGGVQLKMPTEFPVQGELKQFDHCDFDSAYLLVDRFGSDQEIFQFKGKSMPGVQMVQQIFSGAFRDKLVTGGQSEDSASNGMYKFELPLQSGQKIFAQESFSADFSGSSIRIVIRIVHEPK